MNLLRFIWRWQARRYWRRAWITSSIAARPTTARIPTASHATQRTGGTAPTRVRRQPAVIEHAIRMHAPGRPIRGGTGGGGVCANFQAGTPTDRGPVLLEKPKNFKQMFQLAAPAAKTRDMAPLPARHPQDTNPLAPLPARHPHTPLGAAPGAHTHREG